MCGTSGYRRRVFGCRGVRRRGESERWTWPVGTHLVVVIRLVRREAELTFPPPPRMNRSTEPVSLVASSPPEFILTSVWYQGTARHHRTQRRQDNLPQLRSSPRFCCPPVVRLSSMSGDSWKRSCTSAEARPFPIYPNGQRKTVHFTAGLLHDTPLPLVAFLLSSTDRRHTSDLWPWPPTPSTGHAATAVTPLAGVRRRYHARKRCAGIP